MAMMLGNYFKSKHFVPDWWGSTSDAPPPSEPACIDPFQLATMGLGPGFTVFNVATNGFGCPIEIEIITGGGGGGPYPVVSRGPGYYTLDPRFLTKTTKYVMINVRIGDNQWKKHYVVETDKADLAITIINWANRLKENISVGINHIKRVGGKVTALFSRDDK